MPMTRSVQLNLNSWRTVGLETLSVNMNDFVFQCLVLLPTLARMLPRSAPVIVTTGRNIKSFAHTSDGMLLAHNLDPFVPLAGGSEIMPKVFLKCPVARAATRSPVAVS